jgi:hypothetical protein
VFAIGAREGAQYSEGVNYSRVAGEFPRAPAAIAVGTARAIALHLVLRLAASSARVAAIPHFVVLVLGGIPLVYELATKAARRRFGSDLLAGISTVTAAVLGQYLAGSIVVLMLA